MNFQAMRRFKQQITKEECFKVLKEAKRAMVSINGEEGYPYTIPFNFYFDENTEKIYLHTAMQGVFTDLIEKDNKVCVTVLDEGYKVEGDWAWFLNSVIIRGKAYVEEDADHSILMNIGDKYMPDHQEMIDMVKDAAVRTKIIGISIDHMTGKHVHEK